MYCCYFVTISPLWRGNGPFKWRNIHPFTRGCFAPSLFEIGPVVLEKKIFEFCQCHFAVLLLSLLGKGSCHSFEQIWIPFIKECIVPSLVEIGPVVQGKKIFNCLLCIFTISLLSPFEHGCGPSFEEIWISFTQKCFVPSLVESGPAVLEKKVKMCKVYRQMDDNKQNVITKTHSSL